MPAKTRWKNTNWEIRLDASGRISMDGIEIQILLDIRDELQSLNAILHCPNFLNIPSKLDQLVRNTKKAKVKKV